MVASPAPANADEANKLRVFLFPFLASGHQIPMTNLAILLSKAKRSIEPTMVVTPANAAAIAPVISGHEVRVLTFPFPDVGLPPGVENLATASPADEWRIYHAVELLPAAHEEVLREHRPDAVIADIPYWWMTAAAADIGAPRITFHAVGTFPQLAMNRLFDAREGVRKLQEDSSTSTPVVVPKFPNPEISLPKSEMPGFIVADDHLSKNWDKMIAAQLGSLGVVVNTFHGFEPEYCEAYHGEFTKRAYFVGPVDFSVKLSTGADISKHEGNAGCGEADFSRWLDGMPDQSVVFACFGSWAHMPDEQLRQLALGLEASGERFLLAARRIGEWAPEGWEDRVKGRGFVVSGWVPQPEILRHPAVGAFLTHCGWNSLLEAVSARVPMLTWPLVFEQFLSERLVVEVHGCAARLAAGGVRRSAKPGEGEVVEANAVGRAVSEFMKKNGGARRNVEELGKAAAAAVAEGGSSAADLERMIDDLVHAKVARTYVAA